MVEIQENDRVFKLIKPQADFIRSEARYPAYVGGWGTGKSTALIAKGVLLSEKYPGNLGVIFRKEFTDLRDSTIKDFESYTGLKVNSERSVIVGESEIMFRHMEEINNIQNLNLGWYGIEQAEELDTDDQWFMLHGRLRRDKCKRTGFAIANTNGHNWIHRLWKAGTDKDYAVYEANSFDAAGYIPADTMESWRKLEQKKPKLYRRFVLNSWDEADTVDIVIPAEFVEAAMDRTVDLGAPIKKVVSVDVARYGDDQTVFYAVEGGPRRRRVIAKETHTKRSTMETVGLAQIFARKNGDIQSYAVDEIGVGAGVVDRLQELDRHVIGICSSQREGVPPGYYNRRAEIYGTCGDMFQRGDVEMLRDDTGAREELPWTRYRTVKSNGIFQIEDKAEVKKRYGRSPDSADALLYGLWAVSQAKPAGVKDKYARAAEGRRSFGGVAVLG